MKKIRDNNSTLEQEEFADAIVALRNQLAGEPNFGNETVDECNPQGNETSYAIAALRSELSGSQVDLGFEPVLATAIGGEPEHFKFVDPIIEPWFVPEWLSLDQVIHDLSEQKAESEYDKWNNQYWLDFYLRLKKDTDECPLILYAVKSFDTEGIHDVSLMNSASIKAASKCIPSKIIKWLIDNRSIIELYSSNELRSALDALSSLVENGKIVFN